MSSETKQHNISKTRDEGGPMPNSPHEVRACPSILDRLLDDEPEVMREPLHQRFQDVR